ncbi:hypothetical protein pb186bvf_003538 [Paramecium bursaria]
MKSQKKSKLSSNREIKELISKALETRLFILKRLGPTSFKYCDEEERTFKVLIGETISCSCNSNSSHCIHTMHALLKVFKVNEDCPLLYQNSYTAIDINNIISGKYAYFKKQVVPQADKQNIQIKPEMLHDSNRLVIDQDSLCPICQDNLMCNEATTYCKKQCGNNFHAKCMKVWVVQKQASGKQEIGCPMCRADWGQNALVEINIEIQAYEIQNKVHKKTCTSCKLNPIVGNIYLCVQCPNYIQCHHCYDKKVHAHAIYMMKQQNQDNWKLMHNYTVQNLWQQLAQFQGSGSAGNQLMLFGQNVSKSQKCDLCPKKINMRHLPCGHIVDQTCLENQLQQDYYICPLDGQPAFPGLLQSLSKGQLDQIKEKQKITTHIQQVEEKPVLQKQRSNRSSLPPISKSAVKKQIKLPFPQNQRLNSASRSIKQIEGQGYVQGRKRTIEDFQI